MDHSRDLGIDGRIWLRCGIFLITLIRVRVLLKAENILWPAERLSASQEGRCSKTKWPCNKKYLFWTVFFMSH